ncbi:MAG: sigma-54 dependent transcriptional regulator [Desulfobacterales bacterium]
MTADTVFLIDDDPLIRDSIDMALAHKYRLYTFDRAEPALESLQQNPPHLILLDISLPGISGIDALKQIKRDRPDTQVIMITALEDVQTVVSAMKLGAYNYVVKPISLDALKVEMANALESIRLRREVQRLQENYLTENLPFFIGESKTIQQVMSLVAKIARSPDTSVLILGKTGTGKELVAETIHFKSPNFRGPFLSLNCSALPENLVESELFGYEKGAFSGANPDGKQGLIEAAADGTLFLDEVGDLSPGAQAKLLRFLESGEFFKLGSTEKHTVNTRVVSASNKNFEELIEKGLFREDLYFRLSTIQVEIPSLNRRREDIISIANYFLVQFSEKLNRQFTRISPRATAALNSHTWKGNIRELRNMIERAVLVGEEPVIRFQDLGIRASTPSDNLGLIPDPERPDLSGNGPSIPPEGIDLPSLHRSLDIQYIRLSLEMTHGNATRAAELLNISYHAFRRLRSKLGL